MQGFVIYSMIIFHIHVVHPCVWLFMGNRTMPNHTSSNPARATSQTNRTLGSKPAWARYGLISVSVPSMSKPQLAVNWLILIKHNKHKQGETASLGQPEGNNSHLPPPLKLTS